MVAVGFLTATLKKCFFTMCVKSVTTFDRFFKVITVLKNLPFFSLFGKLLKILGKVLVQDFVKVILTEIQMISAMARWLVLSP